MDGQNISMSENSYQIAIFLKMYISNEKGIF